MLNKAFKRTIALALATVTLGLPLMTNDALAASHTDQKPLHKAEHRVEQKAPANNKIELKSNYHNNHGTDYKHSSNHRYESNRHHPSHVQKHENHSSSSSKVATGFVIGAILGAVIANSN